MTTKKDYKINGVSFVASRDQISKENVQPVLNVHANYTAIMPFGFIKNLEHPEIIYNTNKQWFGETTEGVSQYINVLQKSSLQVMLKPQIWVWHGEFTGHIKMPNEVAWLELEQTYSQFILDFAKLAQEKQVALFCIGTELEQFIVHRPEFWQELIKNIRAVYSGELTYAANWDEYKRIPFWNDLDYIGVDAYFPVSDKITPRVEDAITGWQAHKIEMKTVSETFKKPILFTEFGYRSTDYTGKEPWVSDYKIIALNFEGQTNATQALFETFWKEPWFAGGFVWKWFHNHAESGGKKDNQFTPQNKPVEAVIRDYYKRQ
ncbi:MAG: glycoside hydrolase [Flavobacteriaceae bacterium]|nr:glycoside hydrolase [Flavobacteriaceae bacterium]